MKTLVRIQLSAMMFLQFFIWGSWFVTLGSYLATGLHATGAQTAFAYSTQSWGAIIAPFIIGVIADRYVNAEKLLGAIHIAGAVLLYMLAQVSRFDDFYPYLLTYMLLYMPTLGLVNSISFRLMEEPSRDFSKIRLWGTLGWIAAGLVISYVFAWDSRQGLETGMLRNTFLMAAAVSALLGIFSLTLPRTPPQGGGERRPGLLRMLGADAFFLLRDRNFLVFFVASILICIPLAFYYQCTNLFLTELQVEQAAAKQTLGQASEVLFMLALPFFLGRLGIKTTLLVGMLAWTVRYALFAWGDSGALIALLLAGIALHGVCYDFFFVSGQIYTDSKAGDGVKSSAQGLITLATYGVGMLIGFNVAGAITDMYFRDGQHQWSTIWLYPAGFAMLVSVVFAAFFRNVAVERSVPRQEQGLDGQQAVVQRRLDRLLSD